MNKLYEGDILINIVTSRIKLLDEQLKNTRSSTSLNPGYIQNRIAFIEARKYEANVILSEMRQALS